MSRAVLSVVAFARSKKLMRRWAKKDPKIAGFNPWHFSNRSGPQLRGGWDQRLGAVSMPSVVAKLQEIGKHISGGGGA